MSLRDPEPPRCALRAAAALFSATFLFAAAGSGDVDPKEGWVIPAGQEELVLKMLAVDTKESSGWWFASADIPKTEIIATFERLREDDPRLTTPIAPLSAKAGEPSSEKQSGEPNEAEHAPPEAPPAEELDEERSDVDSSTTDASLETPQEPGDEPKEAMEPLESLTLRLVHPSTTDYAAFQTARFAVLRAVEEGEAERPTGLPADLAEALEPSIRRTEKSFLWSTRTGHSSMDPVIDEESLRTSVFSKWGLSMAIALFCVSVFVAARMLRARHRST